MRPLLAMLLAALCAGAEPPPPPDPYGLGERLALLEHLREAYGQKPAPGATVEELRAAYAAAWAARQVPAGDELADTGAADRVARLRHRLADRYGVEADPALDEAGLQALLRRLDGERAARDAEAIADRLAADAARPRAPSPPAAPASPPPAPAAVPAPPVQAPVADAEAYRIRFPAAGVTDCILVSFGERRLLLVTFGADHNGAYRGIPEGVATVLAQAPQIGRSVLLLGHGRSNDVAGESIARHLATHKAFYETMGGTAPAAPIDCLVLAACQVGGQSQMVVMREGLGYFPTWRVASGDFAATTGINVVLALQAIAARPAKPAWRGLFRLRIPEREVVSFGDVGVDGERAETTSFRIVQGEDGRWRTEEQR